MKRWKKISGYDNRPVVADGEKACLVAYDIACGNPELDGRKLLFFSDLHWNGDRIIAADMMNFISHNR
ncbi:MAG: hypothetical protein PHQ27_09185, partial [Victivallales bacterium]|nr:hypothetical protein [Victivallales bacterium]